MDKENSDFCWGAFTGALISIIAGLSIALICWVNSNRGFENKLVIQYHNPNKEYDRQMVMEMVNNSGIATNFINKEVSMSPWRIEWELTNPINSK